MNVLSLFDGISSGQLALQRAGVKVEKYFASEIDKYAIQITQKNFPNTIQLGDVINWREWDLPEIDLLIGGSPCQGFSISGKGLNFNDPRSKLFFEFTDILNAMKPTFFMLENVKMKKEWANIITNSLNVDPLEIDSALVSAQQRKRLYWTNIPNITQPEDKKIYLKDVMEIDTNEQSQDQIIMTKSDFKVKVRKHHIDKKELGLFLREHKKNVRRTNKEIAIHCDVPITKAEHWFRLDGSFSIPDASVWKRLKEILEINNNKYDKAITEFREKDNNFDMAKRIYNVNGKHPTLTTLTGSGKRKTITDGRNLYRLKPLHAERLQNLPDEYTKGVSDAQRFKMLGNGWTVDVIAHILKGIKGK